MSLSLSLFFIYRKDHFLLWVPFFALTGRWLLTLEIIPREYTAICSYTEIILVGLISIQYSRKKLDITAILLLFLGISSVFSLFLSSEHFLFSLFFSICFICSPWIYLFFKDLLLKTNTDILINRIVLIWISLGFLNKIVFGYLNGGAALFQRAGGYFGSNRLAGVIFLLLPLVKNKWITYSAILLLFSQFSKGIIYTLVIYLFFWTYYINRKAFKIVCITFLSLIVFGSNIANIGFQSDGKTVTVKENLVGRFTKGDEQSLIRSLIERVLIDERFVIWNLGIERAKDAYFNGIGLGGSLWEFKKYYTETYGNFHSVYITSLVEGGLVFSLLLLALLIHLWWYAYKSNRRAFIGLIIWSIYAVFSGQLYDVSRAPTCADYFYLLFVAAIVRCSGMEIVQCKTEYSLVSA